MDGLKDIQDRIKHAIEAAAKAEGIALPAVHTERFGAGPMVSVFVFSDDFKDLSSGQRFGKVINWVKDRDHDAYLRIGTLNVLTYAEAHSIEHDTPASGTIMELGDTYFNATG